MTETADPALQASVDARTEALLALLQKIAADYAPASLASSLGAEDMVLTHLIVTQGLPVTIFSLDTGRLPQETYDLMGRLKRHYGLFVTLYYPAHEGVEAFTRAHGINGFYDSVEHRKACCHARKVEPLQRALHGQRAWITGMRAEQAESRAGLLVHDFDESNGMDKFNPLADWSEAEVWAFIRRHGVPYNALYDKGYRSIGCAPCTRAVHPGEHVRAGRWWWEHADGKECGLHRRKV